MRFLALAVAILIVGFQLIEMRPRHKPGVAGFINQPTPTLAIDPAQSIATLTVTAADAIEDVLIETVEIEGKPASNALPIWLGPIKEGETVTQVFHFPEGSLKRLGAKRPLRWSISRKAWWSEGGSASSELNVSTLPL